MGRYEKKNENLRVKMYSLKLSNQVKWFLLKLDSENQKRISDIINKFEKDFKQFPYKKIINKKNTNRVRIGNFRMIYKIFKKENFIKINYRKIVYK